MRVLRADNPSFAPTQFLFMTEPLDIGIMAAGKGTRVISRHNQVLQKLADAGVSAHVSESETSKGTVYRVRTGSYPNRTAANQALAKIRQQGLDGMVIGQ